MKTIECKVILKAYELQKNSRFFRKPKAIGKKWNTIMEMVST
jgi:hypothetical protein